MSAEHVEAAAMHRDIDRAEQWVAEPYSADDTPPNPRRNRRRPVAPRMGRRRRPRGPTWSVASPWTPPAGDTYPVTHPSTSAWTVPDEGSSATIRWSWGWDEGLRPAWRHGMVRRFDKDRPRPDCQGRWACACPRRRVAGCAVPGSARLHHHRRIPCPARSRPGKRVGVKVLHLLRDGIRRMFVGDDSATRSARPSTQPCLEPCRP